MLANVTSSFHSAGLIITNGILLAPLLYFLEIATLIWALFVSAKAALANIDKMFDEGFLTNGCAWKSLCDDAMLFAYQCCLPIRQTIQSSKQRSQT